MVMPFGVVGAVPLPPLRVGHLGAEGEAVAVHVQPKVVLLPLPLALAALRGGGPLGGGCPLWLLLLLVLLAAFLPVAVAQAAEEADRLREARAP